MPRRARRKAATKRRRSSPVRRRRRNAVLATLNPGGRRKRRSVVAKRKRSTRRKRYTPRRRARRRNPAFSSKLFGLSLPNFGTVAWAVAGAAGTQALPNLVLPAQAARGGVVAYALELVSASVVAMGAKMIGGQKAASAALTGGGVRLVWHVLDDMGLFASVPGLQGYGFSPQIPGAAPLDGYLDAGTHVQYPEEMLAMGYGGDGSYSLGGYLDPR